MSQSKEYPDKRSVQVYRRGHIEAVENALQTAEGELDDDPAQTEKVAHIAATYTECRQFRRLKEDKRIQEAIEVVAKDHGVDPVDVSLVELLKITAGAYTGFAQTSDWNLQESETV